MMDESATGYREGENPLAASGVPILDALSGPWVIQKVRALGELHPGAGRMLEEALDGGQLPEEISLRLRREFGLRLSVLEVARYGAWLPHLRRHALLKAQQRSEQLVAEARKRMEEEHR
jgi:hypothetical protein